MLRVYFCWAVMSCFLLGSSSVFSQNIFDSKRVVPTSKGFQKFILDLREGALNSFESVKGKQRMGDREPTWGIRPIEGCYPDWEGYRHTMNTVDGLIHGTYVFQEIKKRPPSAEAWKQMKADFELYKSWLIAAKGDWFVAELQPQRKSGVKTYSWIQCKIWPPNSKPEVHITLTLFSYRHGDSKTAGETLLYLKFGGEGVPAVGDGAAYKAMRAAAEPAIALPEIPATFDTFVRDLVADAPTHFASFRASDVPYKKSADVKSSYHGLPKLRWPAGRVLLDIDNPAASVNLVAESHEGAVSEARFVILSTDKPTYGTTVAIENRFEQLEDRLHSLFPNWDKIQISQPAGEGRAMGQRLTQFHGIRPDARPIALTLLLRRWHRNEHAQIIMFVETQHDRAAGLDVHALLIEALAADPPIQPLTDLFAIFGNPIPEGIRPGDLVASLNQQPIRLEDLYGHEDTSQMQYRVARGDGYVSISGPSSAVSLKQYVELINWEQDKALSASALSFIGERIKKSDIQALVGGLIEAAPDEFKTTPEICKDLVIHNQIYQRLEVTLPLWRSKESPPLSLVKSLQIKIIEALPRHWHSSGGPNGLKAYPSDDMSALQCELFLNETTSSGIQELRLKIRAFSKAHQSAGRNNRLSLFFEVLPAENGKKEGVYSYNNGWTFYGPHKDGVPHGSGSLVWAKGRVVKRAIFANGFRDWSQESIVAKRAAKARQRIRDEQYSKRKNSWKRYKMLSASKSKSTGKRRVKGRKPYRPTGRYDICRSCRGRGWISSTVTERDYRQTMAFPGSKAWRQGYSHVRVYSGYNTTRLADVKCGSCFGIGRRWYSYR